jgi:hypothetical protein
LDTILSIWILKHPKYKGLFIFGKGVFKKFAFLKRNRLFYQKAVILRGGTVFAPLVEDS